MKYLDTTSLNYEIKYKLLETKLNDILNHLKNIDLTIECEDKVRRIEISVYTSVQEIMAELDKAKI